MKINIGTAGTVDTWLRPYSQNEVLKHFNTWNTNPSSQRFGQWWWNNHGHGKLGIPACPDLFHENNRGKALAYIQKNFVDYQKSTVPDGYSFNE